MLIKFTLNEVTDFEIIALLQPWLDKGLTPSLAAKKCLVELSTIQKYGLNATSVPQQYLSSTATGTLDDLKPENKSGVESAAERSEQQAEAALMADFDSVEWE